MYGTKAKGNRWISGFYVRVGMDLTPRELAVLKLIADGANSEIVGEHLGISKRTVDIYRTRVLAKLRAKSSAHAVSIAHKSGLLECGEILGYFKPSYEIQLHFV